MNEKGKKAVRNYIVDTDEGLRADTTVEGLSKLKAAFAVGGSVTAGNSSQTSDGAAFTIVMSERMVKELKASRTLPGVTEIRVPGESSARSKSKRLTQGIPIPPGLLKALNECAQLAGVKPLEF